MDTPALHQEKGIELRPFLGHQLLLLCRPSVGQFGYTAMVMLRVCQSRFIPISFPRQCLPVVHPAARLLTCGQNPGSCNSAPQ